MEWQITTTGTYTISHPIIAITPGCPTAPHPTRNCRCKVFRTRTAAQKYVNEQTDET
jgi:hypothetical protein